MLTITTVVIDHVVCNIYDQLLKNIYIYMATKASTSYMLADVRFQSLYGFNHWGKISKRKCVDVRRHGNNQLYLLAAWQHKLSNPKIIKKIGVGERKKSSRIIGVLVET